MSENEIAAPLSEETPHNGIDETPVSRREIMIVYAGFMVIMALAALDQSIVATALPRIVSDLGGVTRSVMDRDRLRARLDQRDAALRKVERSIRAQTADLCGGADFSRRLDL